MCVPAHDQRDFEFAKEYGLPIVPVIEPEGTKLVAEDMTEAYEEPGVMVNSGQFSGLPSESGKEKIIEYIEKKKIGKRRVNYRLRDWGISRQTLLGRAHTDRLLRYVRHRPRSRRRSPGRASARYRIHG